MLVQRSSSTQGEEPAESNAAPAGYTSSPDEEKAELSLRAQVASFSGLEKITRDNRKALEGLRRLVGNSAADSSSSGPVVDDTTKFQELDRLLTMASALGEVAVRTTLRLRRGYLRSRAPQILLTLSPTAFFVLGGYVCSWSFQRVPQSPLISLPPLDKCGWSLFCGRHLSDTHLGGFPSTCGPPPRGSVLPSSSIRAFDFAIMLSSPSLLQNTLLCRTSCCIWRNPCVAKR